MPENSPEKVDISYSFLENGGGGMVRITGGVK
jgi:hypothetical protein